VLAKAVDEYVATIYDMMVWLTSIIPNGTMNAVTNFSCVTGSCWKVSLITRKPMEVIKNTRT